MSMNVSVTSIGSQFVALLRLRTAANGNIVRVYVNGAGVLWIKSDVSGATDQLLRPPSVPVGTTLSSVEVRERGASTATGRRSSATWTANTGSTPIGRIEIGDTLARTFTVNYDDVVVDLAPG